MSKSQESFNSYQGPSEEFQLMMKAVWLLLSLLLSHVDIAVAQKIFKGCFQDSHALFQTDRVAHNSDASNTNQRCEEYCHDLGFAIIATRSTDCYCMNEFPLPVVEQPEDKSTTIGMCNAKCPGVAGSSCTHVSDCCGDSSAGMYSVFAIGTVDVLQVTAARIRDAFAEDEGLVPKFFGSSMYETVWYTCNFGQAGKDYGIKQGRPSQLLETIEVKIRGDETTSQNTYVMTYNYITGAKTFKLDTSNPSSGENVDDYTVELEVIEMEEVTDLKRTYPMKKEILGLQQCYNTYTQSIDCRATQTKTETFQEALKIESGTSLTVSSSTEISGLFDSVKQTFGFSGTFSLTAGVTQTSSTAISSQVMTIVSVAPGDRVQVEVFSESVPVTSQWTAKFFVYGGAKVTLNGQITRFLDLNQILLDPYVFGTGIIDYGLQDVVKSKVTPLQPDGSPLNDGTETVISTPDNLGTAIDAMGI